MTEIFKDIEGWEGKYQISNLGRVKGFLYVEWPRQHFTKKRYLTVTLMSPRRTLSVHRLVAKAFISTTNYTLQVNHLNGNKSDNRVENLEWCTGSENVKHSYAIGAACNKGERHPQSTFTNDEVLFMRMVYKFGQLSVKQIAAEFSAQYGTIWKIVKGINYSHL